VSLVADIIQLFGTSSVPVVVAGTVLGVFELGERLASQRAKDALSKWLVSFDIQKAKALPDGTQDLFERIFGERHFSMKCLIRSAVFSLAAMVVLAILVFLTAPDAADVMSFALINIPLIFALWLPWSFIVDYISLLKTRVILRILTRIPRTALAFAILLIDFLVYVIIWFIGISLNSALYMYYNELGSGFWNLLQSKLELFHNMWRYIPTHIVDETLTFIFFWAGFAPSIWMWLYVLALFVTRGLLRSERIVNWLRWFLDVEKNPFRSIGAVAAALAFIASVAIILVSAEVSRITTAS
jgi:hypothetical protein